MQVEIGDWQVDLIVDDDGHLTVEINHADGSKVHQLEVDVTANDTEWAERFSTECVERAYIDSQKCTDDFSDLLPVTD